MRVLVCLQDPSLTSPYELFQFFRRMDEQTAGIMLKQLTGACTYNRPCAHQYVGKYQSCMVSKLPITCEPDLPLTEIEELVEAQAADPAAAVASSRLGASVVTWVHGTAAAKAAMQTTVREGFLDH